MLTAALAVEEMTASRRLCVLLLLLCGRRLLHCASVTCVGLFSQTLGLNQKGTNHEAQNWEAQISFFVGPVS